VSSQRDDRRVHDTNADRHTECVRVTLFEQPKASNDEADLLPRAPRYSVSTLLAWRNLAHDRIRLLVAVIGIAFAVVLMAVQLSLLFGFAETAAGLITHAGVDLWICERGTKNVDQVFGIPARRQYQALEVPGVASAENYIVQFLPWRRPNGGNEFIVLVGYNVDRGIGGPWNLVQGSAEDLKRPNGIIVDELYTKRLGVTRVGQTIEISNRRARVVALTHGVRTFVQAPYVFASLKTAQTLANMRSDDINYVLVQLQSRADLGEVKRALEAKMPTVDIYDSATFARSTQVYWLFSTGAGLDLIIAALLGVVIGVVVTAQTLYASAVDHLPEYAALRAMGASNGYLRAVIFKQALIAAVLGYAIGISTASFVVWVGQDGDVAMRLPWQLVLGLGVLTVGMCTLSGLIVVRRVTTINPTSVFR
jgi:putative ABC transport system permease protein